MSYILNRGISVIINGYSSNFHVSTASISQDSVLSLTLFLLYINYFLFFIFTLSHSSANDFTFHASVQNTSQSIITQLNQRCVAISSKNPGFLENVGKIHNFSLSFKKLFQAWSHSHGQSLLTSLSNTHVGLSFENDLKFNNPIFLILLSCRKVSPLFQCWNSCSFLNLCTLYIPQIFGIVSLLQYWMYSLNYVSRRTNHVLSANILTLVY